MYPRLKIYLKRIEENTRVVRQLCADHGIRVMGVTKACCGAPELAEAYLAGGLAMIGDSRVAHPSVHAFGNRGSGPLCGCVAPV